MAHAGTHDGKDLQTMAKVHRSYRLDEDTVRRVSEWAEANGVTTTQAMETLLEAALGAGEATEKDVGADAADTTATRTAEAEGVDELLRRVDTLTAQAETWREQRTMLGEHVRDLRATVSTLTAQVAEKDRQIERLQDITDHAQMLQAAHVAGALQAPAAHDGTQKEAQTDAQPKGLWAWLARKIDGR